MVEVEFLHFPDEFIPVVSDVKHEETTTSCTDEFATNSTVTEAFAVELLDSWAY